MTTTAIVINNSGGALMPSETFLRDQIELLPGKVIPVVGIPCDRRLIKEGGRSLNSQSVIARTARWAARRLGVTSLMAQDTATFARFLEQRRVDVVLAQYGPTAVTVLPACREAGVPLVPHFHGFDAYREQVVASNRAGYEALFEYAPAIIAVSTHMKERLVELGAPAGKIHVNPCGCNVPDAIQAQPHLAPPTFVMVGRLVDKKAPLNTLRAYARVAQKHPDAHLDIVGDGPLRPACEALADELGIRDRITFHGPQPHAETLQIMARARCFVQHSVVAPDGDREGTPVSVLEAMALGLPVIATCHGGIPDAVLDGQHGHLVDEGDWEATATWMLRYAEDGNVARVDGEAGRSYAKLNHAVTKRISDLHCILRGARPRSTCDQDEKHLSCVT